MTLLIVAASSRAQERRVRDGYVNQDEVAKYEARGSQMRREAPKCPGFYDDEPAKPASGPKLLPRSAQPASQPQPRPQSARKQSARQQPTQPPAAPRGRGGGGPSSERDVAAAAAALAAASLQSAEAEKVEAPLEKRMRAAKKKLRAVEELEAKLVGGATLQAEQAEKVAKLQALRAEVAQLERELEAAGIQH